MSNLPVSANSISEASKSLKQVASAKIADARDILNRTRNLALTSVPSIMETVKGTMTALTGTIQNLVDSKCKEETGYSISEIKYKTLEGKRLIDEYVQLGKSEIKKISDKKDKAEELKNKKNKALYRLTEWLKNQSDAVYNGFILVQVKEICNQVVLSANQLFDGGTTLVKQNLESMNALKQIFVQGSGVFKKDEEQKKISSEIAIGSNSQESIEDFLAELQKSAKSIGGEEFKAATELSEKGMCETAKTVLSILMNLISVSSALYTLVENYNTNKQSLADDAAKMSNSVLKDNAERMGLTETSPNNPSSNTLDTANYIQKQEERVYEDTQKDSSYKKITPDVDEQDEWDASIKNADYQVFNKMEIKSGNTDASVINDKTQLYNMDFMKFVSDVPEKDVEHYYNPKIRNVNHHDPSVNPDDNRTVPDGSIGFPKGYVMSTPSSDEVYYCETDEELIFSEVDRVVFELDDKQNYCRLDLNNPLYSISTKTDGGKMVNLEFSGNNRKEMREAILLINGGVRL